MAHKGPPRRPRELRLIAGTLRRDRDDTFERPIGEALSAADCPDWLTPEAARVWRELATQGRLLKIDAGVLSVLALAIDLHARAAQALLLADGAEYRALERVVSQQARIIVAATAQLRLPIRTPPAAGNSFDRNGRRPEDGRGMV